MSAKSRRAPAMPRFGGAWTSAKRLVGWVAAGVVGFVFFVSCDHSAGLERDFAAAELMTSGAVGGQNWLVVRLEDGVLDDCLELRTLGAAAERFCEPEVQAGRTMLRAVEVNGTMLLFGMLPAAATRAEVEVAGQPSLPLRLRPFGGSKHYVIETAPPGTGWSYGDAVPVTGW
jgi:hypothetical protein